MSWYNNVVLWLGIFDAVVLLTGGLAAAIVVLLGIDATKTWERVGPAIALTLGSTVAAGIILTITRWALS